MSNLTNPAAELHALCSSLKQLPPGRDQSTPTRDVLANAFGVSGNDTQFLAILTSLSARFDRLAELIGLIPQYAAPQKQSALSAVSSLRGFLRPHVLNTPWHSIRESVFKPDFLLPVHMIDPLIQQIAPIAVPTEEEKKDLLTRLEEAIGSLHQENSLTATSLAVSLQAVIRILSKLEFFGVDELFRSLLTAETYLRAAHAESKQNSHGSGVHAAIRKAALALSLAFNVLTVSDTGFTAVENDYRRGQAMIQFLSSEIDIPPLQLPAPELSKASPSEGILPNEPQSAQAADDAGR